MNTVSRILFLCCTLALGLNIAYAQNLDPATTLWYDAPAERWTEALPVGNGRLGAMIYGRTDKEIIQFNEDTLWTGQPTDYAHKDAHLVLSDLRQLLWEGKQDEAHKLANERFMSKPLGQFAYAPFGNILIDFPGHKNPQNYKRKLDLESAISSINYDIDGTTFTREVIASEPHQAVVVNLEASQEGALNFNLRLDSPHAQYEVSVDGDEIVLRGKVNHYAHRKGREPAVPYPESKMKFEARVKVVTEGGQVSTTKESLRIANATTATLYLIAATNYVNYDDISADPGARCDTYIANVENVPFSTIRKTHLDDYKNLFDRVKIDLGVSAISKRPTNERLFTFTQDEDPNLVALLYHYGRYLLISSSRPGTQPANLQGIWNDKLMPPWDSKYTINVNTEMNYWLAEATNLSELTAPLTAMINDLTVTGKRIAKEHYDMPGWVTHHNTDIWRGAAPINNANHGIWPTGGAWLSQNLWWHYQYTNDVQFLENVAYPVFKEASEFFIHYLVPDPKNPEWLVSGPSNSPETGGLVMAPTMDHQIIRNLFSNTIETASILGVDPQFVDVLKQTRSKIAPNLIGKHGQLQEWLIDQDDPENEHRHVSHLWGLHPGTEIHPLTTPKLAEASKVTLSHRGDGGTGWSRAWKINFWARLLDGDHSFLLLKNLIVPSHREGDNVRDVGGLYNNLFDSHPPFQIDGNFGVTSGITEMLLQSHLRDENGHYYQDILPALASNFSTGKISGIKGRGAFEFTIEWDKGALTALEIISIKGNPLHVRYNGTLISRETKPGQTMSFTISDFNDK